MKTNLSTSALAATLALRIGEVTLHADDKDYSKTKQYQQGVQ